MLTQIHKTNCASCDEVLLVPADLEDKTEPESALCPHCIVGLALLSREEDIEWVRIARIQLPGDGQDMWLAVTEEVEQELEGTEYEDVCHGDVWNSDEISGTDANNEVDVHGKLSARSQQGTKGFTVTRELLAKPDIQTTLERVFATARERQAAHE